VESKPVAAGELVSPITAAGAFPSPVSVKLARLVERAVYIVETEDGDRLVDARTGRPIPSPSRYQIRQAADYWYTGAGRLSRLSLIHEVPGEIRGRKAPLWRAEFQGWNKPTLYFAPSTGQLVSRRHELWRIFDFLWMLHIMDYDTRDNVNNWLLRSFTVLALTTVLSGVWLLWFAFRRRRHKASGR
jgi:hypothetical protein